MTYGIQIKNEYGEDLIDTSVGVSYYKKSSGTCYNVQNETIIYQNPAIYTTVRAVMPAAGIGTSFRVPLSSVYYHNRVTGYASFYYINDWIQFACDDFEDLVYRFKTTSTPSERTYAHPKAISDNPDDMIFFKMPSTGIISAGQVWMPFTGTNHLGYSLTTGLHGYCIPAGALSSNIQYQVVSTDVPATQSSNYGLQVYDTDGTTLQFDTSRDIVSFVDYLSLTATEVQDIIENDATYSFTLRSAISGGAWIAGEGASGSSFRAITGTSTQERSYHVMIKQTSSTQMEVSRLTLNTPQNGSISNSDVSYYAPMLFVIADFN